MFVPRLCIVRFLAFPVSYVGAETGGTRKRTFPINNVFVLSFSRLFIGLVSFIIKPHSHRQLGIKSTAAIFRYSSRAECGIPLHVLSGTACPAVPYAFHPAAVQRSLYAAECAVTARSCTPAPPPPHTSMKSPPPVIFVFRGGGGDGETSQKSQRGVFQAEGNLGVLI